MQMYAYGHDFGNSETCGVLYDTTSTMRTKKVPTIVAQSSLEELARLRGATGRNYEHSIDALSSDEHVLEFQGRELFIGELALSDTHNGTSARGDIHRYWNQHSLEMLLTVSGLMQDDKEYGLLVVTGLPVRTFTSENRKRIREALTGEYNFILDGKRRKAVIDVPFVIMEGAGASIYYGLPGKVRQGTIDIGGRTTDLYVSLDQKPVVDFCKGQALGVEDIGETISRRFNTQYKRDLESHERRAILLGYIQGKAYEEPIYADGKEVSMSLLYGWVHAAINAIGQDIASFVSAKWNSSETGAIGSNLARILLVGGGAYYFAENIKERIPHVTIPDMPELANAQGYATLALQALRRKNTAYSSLEV